MQNNQIDISSEDSAEENRQLRIDRQLINTIASDLLQHLNINNRNNDNEVISISSNDSGNQEINHQIQSFDTDAMNTSDYFDSAETISSRQSDQSIFGSFFGSASYEISVSAIDDLYSDNFFDYDNSFSFIFSRSMENSFRVLPQQRSTQRQNNLYLRRINNIFNAFCQQISEIVTENQQIDWQSFQNYVNQNDSTQNFVTQCKYNFNTPKFVDIHENIAELQSRKCKYLQTICYKLQEVIFTLQNEVMRKQTENQKIIDYRQQNEQSSNSDIYSISSKHDNLLDEENSFTVTNIKKLVEQQLKNTKLHSKNQCIDIDDSSNADKQNEVSNQAINEQTNILVQCSTNKEQNQELNDESPEIVNAFIKQLCPLVIPAISNIKNINKLVKNIYKSTILCEYISQILSKQEYDLRVQLNLQTIQDIKPFIEYVKQVPIIQQCFIPYYSQKGSDDEMMNLKHWHSLITSVSACGIMFYDSHDIHTIDDDWLYYGLTALIECNGCLATLHTEYQQIDVLDLKTREVQSSRFTQNFQSISQNFINQVVISLNSQYPRNVLEQFDNIVALQLTIRHSSYHLNLHHPAQLISLTLVTSQVINISDFFNLQYLAIYDVQNVECKQLQQLAQIKKFISYNVTFKRNKFQRTYSLNRQITNVPQLQLENQQVNFNSCIKKWTKLEHLFMIKSNINYNINIDFPLQKLKTFILFNNCHIKINIHSDKAQLISIQVLQTNAELLMLDQAYFPQLRLLQAFNQISIPNMNDLKVNDQK